MSGQGYVFLIQTNIFADVQLNPLHNKRKLKKEREEKSFKIIFILANYLGHQTKIIGILILVNYLEHQTKIIGWRSGKIDNFETNMFCQF